MATSTFGSNTTSALPFSLQAPGSFITPAGTARSSAALDADIATVQQAIKDDLTNTNPINTPQGGWSRAGMLYVPNRGWLKVLPGDWVAVDTQGWPILISANSIANSLWTHTP